MTPHPLFGSPDRNPRPAASLSSRLAWLGKHHNTLGLLTMALIPLAFALFRLAWLADTPAPSALDTKARTFIAEPLPLVLHVTSAPLFGGLGALLFSSPLLAKRPDVHRLIGKAVAISGLVAALSGLWLTLSLHAADPSVPVRTGMRLVVGSTMLASILVALFAIALRDVRSHRIWMTRAYAIGLSESTQAILLFLTFLALGELTPSMVTLMIALGWAINLSVAETHLRNHRPAPRRPRRLSAI
jgi:hypothetical protein